MDDLVLFFGDSQATGQDGKPSIVSKWLPFNIYTSPELKAAPASVPPGWPDIVYMEAKTPQNEPYYYVNLARLVPPLLPEDIAPSRQVSGFPDVKQFASSTSKKGDLVIVPYDDPGSCYRIPQDLYMKCPSLDEKDIADIDFMAVQEGVLLANIPKVDLTGITCYLLNLLSLRSNVMASGLNKASHARDMSVASRAPRAPAPGVRSGV